MRRISVCLAWVVVLGCGRGDGGSNERDAASPMPDGASVASDAPMVGLDAAGGAAAVDARSSDVAAPGTPSWCDAERVLIAKCQKCHSSPPKFGAPVPLVTYADTQATSPSNGSNKVWQFMKEYVESGFMPMGDEKLTAAEKSTLLGWLDGGMPAPTGACAPAPDGGVSAPTPLPCTPSHELRAYGASPSVGYGVPRADDTIVCFPFQVPFAAGEQATAWAPILDDERVVHHWIVYAHGTTKPVGCRDPERVFVMGWAPGGDTYVLPQDIGLELPAPGRWLTLEVHYNNKARHANVVDRSGVSICTTKTARPKLAGVMTFGSLDITIPPDAVNHPVTSDCGPQLTRLLPAPLHVLAAFPHMHQIGTTFRTDVTSGGVTQTLVHVPRWDFNDQKSYRTNPDTMLIKPGDNVRTTCTYSNPSNAAVRFGGASEAEMCFNFVTVYPIPDPSLRTCVR